MTIAELLDVVDAIAALLSLHGHEDKAAWMSERAAVLKSPESGDEDIASARDELHSIVMGMGGLFDLALEPAGSNDASAAREALDDLADRLYVLTG